MKGTYSDLSIQNAVPPAHLWMGLGQGGNFGQMRDLGQMGMVE